VKWGVWLNVIHDMCRSVNIIKTAKHRRLGLAAYTARTREKNALKFMVGNILEVSYIGD
jgi:hypothetical protein